MATGQEWHFPHANQAAARSSNGLGGPGAWDNDNIAGSSGTGAPSMRLQCSQSLLVAQRAATPSEARPRRGVARSAASLPPCAACGDDRCSPRDGRRRWPSIGVGVSERERDTWRARAFMRHARHSMLRVDRSMLRIDDSMFGIDHCMRRPDRSMRRTQGCNRPVDRSVPSAEAGIPKVHRLHLRRSFRHVRDGTFDTAQRRAQPGHASWHPRPAGPQRRVHGRVARRRPRPLSGRRGRRYLAAPAVTMRAGRTPVDCPGRARRVPGLCRPLHGVGAAFLVLRAKRRPRSSRLPSSAPVERLCSLAYW